MKSDSSYDCPVGHGNSIANLAASLATALGSATGTPAGELIASHDGLADQLSASNLIVFLLLDGVGANQIATHVPNGALAADQRGVISSVFPSSTAPAITSLMSGASVGHHGITGWHLQESASSHTTRPLPMDLRDQPGTEAPDTVHQWMPWVSNANAQSIAIQPNIIVNSTYSTYCNTDAERYGYQDFSEIPALLESVLEKLSGDSKRFCYIYIPDFDATSHHHGWQSPQAAQCMSALDKTYKALANRVAQSGGVMVTVSDHGFTDIDADKQYWLNDFPELYQCFEKPLSGEPRAAICHVREGQHDQFLEQAANTLSSICAVRRTEDLIRENWFGAVPDAPQRYRFGTHWLIPHDGYAVMDQLEHEKRPRLIGMHGGISSSEMQVPLIVRL